MKILLIDNHDSFVWNLVGLLRDCRTGIGHSIQFDVVRCDESLYVPAEDYAALILSPGPGLPHEATGLPELIARCADTHPMLGICLGHQAIAAHFGGTLRQLPDPRHGHCSTLVQIDAADPLIGSLAGKQPRVGRYHSWIVDEASLPETLLVTARDEDGCIMALRHRSLPLYGTQFHPESIISDCGQILMRNFLNQVRACLRDFS